MIRALRLPERADEPRAGAVEEQRGLSGE